MISFYPNVYPQLDTEHQKDLEARKVLLIDRHVAEEVLTPEACMDALESALKEEGRGGAVNRGKANIHVPEDSGTSSYRYCSMEGGIRNKKVVAIRIKSDVSTPRVIADKEREDWYCVYPGRFMGLVLLFSAVDGALLAILHDAHIQHMRVAATYALATQKMAREDSEVLGILGSGGMAWAHSLFYSKIRKIKKIKVYSPNAEHRADFVQKLASSLPIEVEAQNNPEKVVRGSDIVASCTNTLDPVVRGEWLEEGMHFTIVKTPELDDEGYKLLDKYVLYTSGSTNLFTFKPDNEFIRRFSGGTYPELAAHVESLVGKQKMIWLPEILLGLKTGRDNGRQITCFRGEGTGVQFAAVAMKVFEEASRRKLGQSLPLEWFLQDVTN